MMITLPTKLHIRLAGVLAALLLMASLPQAKGQTTPSAPPQPLAIGSRDLPVAVAGQPFGFQFTASGGTPPMLWQLLQGNLPPGLRLDASGALAGTPTSLGDFRFVIALTDSSQPRSEAQAEFVLRVRTALVAGWALAPNLQESTVSGQLAVTNNTDHGLNLTVIVVAINDIGKAFALGYQHITLEPHAFELAIPFGSSLPPGNYLVHADVVAEDVNTGALYRSYLDSPAAFTVNQI